MQKLADLSITGDPLCPEGPMWPREGTLCGCWWAMREVELSTAWCMQITFLGGPDCGRCVIDLPVTKSDPQTFVACNEREVCDPSDGACLPSHWSAGHGGGRCRCVVDSGILSVVLQGYIGVHSRLSFVFSGGRVQESHSRPSAHGGTGEHVPAHGVGDGPKTSCGVRTDFQTSIGSKSG